MVKDIKALAKDFEKLIKKYNLSNARITYTAKNKEIYELISSENRIWLHKHKEIWEKLR
jgi:hypothetical protein